jgi:hypothetical protein
MKRALERGLRGGVGGREGRIHGAKIGRASDRCSRTSWTVRLSLAHGDHHAFDEDIGIVTTIGPDA